MRSEEYLVRLFSSKMYLLVLVAALAVSIGLQMVLEFPYGFGAALAIFIAFPLILRKLYAGRLRGYGGSGTDMGRGGGFFGFGSGKGSSVKYVCLVCSNRYNGGSCPRCGSKVKRADF